MAVQIGPKIYGWSKLLNFDREKMSTFIIFENPPNFTEILKYFFNVTMEKKSAFKMWFDR